MGLIWMGLSSKQLHAILKVLQHFNIKMFITFTSIIIFFHLSKSRQICFSSISVLPLLFFLMTIINSSHNDERERIMYIFRQMVDTNHRNHNTVKVYNTKLCSTGWVKSIFFRISFCSDTSDLEALTSVLVIF